MFAAMLIIVDVRVGMPWFWIVGEGVGNICLGSLILVMAYRLKPLDEEVTNG